MLVSSSSEKKINYFILNDPSADVPQRKVKLLTYAVSKKVKRKIKLIEKERKLVSKCVRRSLAWNAKVDIEYQHHGGQYLELPRAISDPYGRPHTGNKSYATRWLENRYQGIVTNTLPNVPEVAILEGMCMINISPLCTHRSLLEYSLFLLRRFMLPQFIAGTREVHIIFDVPGKLTNFPKAIERQRRDEESSQSLVHHHIVFSDEIVLPADWRQLLSCRQCKRSLVLYLGECYKSNAGKILRDNQRLILAGCFQGDDEDLPLLITSNGTQPVHALKCNAEETDTRLWLHVVRSAGSHKLVWSPDTDVFHVGLPIMPCYPAVHAIVQINTYHSSENRYLLMDKLYGAMKNDPDLATIPIDCRPKLLQSLFICSGCDFISFFAGLGKAKILKVAFQHSDFINSNSDALPGSLVNTTESQEVGFLAFLRLIGTVYYKKHLSSFPFESPRAFVNSLSSQTDESRSQHLQWLETIRNTIWEHIEFEDELPPSSQALWRHWLRTCWVSQYWSQATENSYNTLDVTHHGWKCVDGQVEIDWDAPENILKVQQNVRLLLRGCSCKKGCINRRCRCVKDGRKCGPGCSCHNCQNQAYVSTPAAEVECEVEEEELRQDEAY